MPIGYNASRARVNKNPLTQTFGRPTDWSSAAIASNHAPKVDAASLGASITTRPLASPRAWSWKKNSRTSPAEGIAATAGLMPSSPRSLVTAKPLSPRSPVTAKCLSPAALCGSKHHMSALHIRDNAGLVRHAIRMGILGADGSVKNAEIAAVSGPENQLRLSEETVRPSAASVAEDGSASPCSVGTLLGV